MSPTGPWQPGRAEIEDLLKRGHLERVTPNQQFATDTLDQCDTHIASAKAIQHSDQPAALAIAYDAARKALAAILLNEGLRPTSIGGHIACIDAVDAQVRPPLDAARDVHRVRRRRHRNEYPNPDDGTVTTTSADVTDAIDVAEEAVA
uniref:HEPN domain-containing protein n=1 Tax=Agromyces humi TaxID=1766800 RepID=UPI001359CC03